MEGIKKITAEMYAALKKPLPVEAVNQHPTKTFLSTIKAIYVTERLNDVFGCGSWQIRTEKISESEKGFVVIRTTLSIPEYGVYYESYGGNDNGGENSKNFDLGDAYKGATTDGITKIGSYLGIGIDVFKGKQQGNKQPAVINEKKWLNKMDDQKNFTKEWLNVVSAINAKKINSVSDVEKYYKISESVKTELQEIFNYQE